MSKLWRFLFGWVTELVDEQAEKQVEEATWRTKPEWRDTRNVMEFSFQTRKIQRQLGPAGDGGAEFFLCECLGDEADGCGLIQAGDGRDEFRLIIRYGYGQNKLICNIYRPSTLPDVHRWTLRWGSDLIQVMLDGHLICSEFMPGNIVKILVGGCQDGRRNFKGEWRVNK